MVFMPHWPKILGKNKPIDLGLDRIIKLLDRLGNPQDKLPPVVHVSGTNGKGSSIAFMRSILQAAGYKVHTYTSPHLLNFNERINLAGKDISDGFLKEVMEECRIATGDIPITFFEGTTAGAYLAFSKVDADIVLLETGLGGRLDATNVISSPALTLITSISLDHTEYLGPTVELIAGEKVGILKEGAPCISSLQTEEVENIIEKKAEDLDIPLLAFGYDWVVEKQGDKITYKSPELEIDLPEPSLYGDHQIINAGNAITSVLNLKDFNVSVENIKEGMKNAKWPARLQKIAKGKLIDLLPKDSEIWIDGAHNEAAAHVLSNTVENWSDKPLYMICGMTKGRDVTAFLKFFKGKTTFVGGVLVETEPSAIAPKLIKEAALSLAIDSEEFDSIQDALYSINKGANGGIRVLFCGSLYLASDVLKIN